MPNWSAAPSAYTASWAQSSVMPSMGRWRQRTSTGTKWLASKSGTLCRLRLASNTALGADRFRTAQRSTADMLVARGMTHTSGKPVSGSDAWPITPHSECPHMMPRVSKTSNSPCRPDLSASTASRWMALR